MALILVGISSMSAQTAVIIPPKKTNPGVQKAYEKARTKVKVVQRTPPKVSVSQRDNYGINTTQIVDLGLSVKWAGWNIGGSKPQDYGIHCGWGDPTAMAKSTSNADFFPNQKSICGTRLDVARSRWGQKWRMPSAFEMMELHNECKWQWITYKGVQGCKVTGPNGNSIFLPAAGYREGNETDGINENCTYWSGQYDPTAKGSAFYIEVEKFDREIDRDFGSEEKHLGFSIRAVYDSGYPTIELNDDDLKEYGFNSRFFDSYNIAINSGGKWGDWQKYQTRIAILKESAIWIGRPSQELLPDVYKIVSQQNPVSDGDGGKFDIYNVTDPAGNSAVIRFRTLKDGSYQLYLEDEQNLICFGDLVERGEE